MTNLYFDIFEISKIKIFLMNKKWESFKNYFQFYKILKGNKVYIQAYKVLSKAVFRRTLIALNIYIKNEINKLCTHHNN